MLWEMVGMMCDFKKYLVYLKKCRLLDKRTNAQNNLFFYFSLINKLQLFLVLTYKRFGSNSNSLI